MYSNGWKLLAIICILATISPRGVITTSQSIDNSSIELQAFKNFLDYNYLKHAIIIYSPLCITSLSSSGKLAKKGCVNVNKDNFMSSYLLQHLTENYHLQFLNILSAINFEQLFYYQSPKVGVFMKYSAKDGGKENLLQLASKQEKFNNSLAWFIVTDKMKFPLKNIFHIFGHLNVMLNADITVAFHRYNFTLELYDIYKICHFCGSSLVIEYKGNWSALEDFKLLKIFQYGIVIRRNNFQNITINAATTLASKTPHVNLTNFEYLNNDKDHMESDSMQRKTYQLVKLMEQLYNFTLNIHFSDKWGNYEFGNWTGIVGLLERREVELSVCPMRFAANRISVITYSLNIHTEKIYFLFRHPKHSSIRNIFFEPLADTVWWCYLAVIFITIILLFIHLYTGSNVMVAAHNNEQLNKVTISENSFDFIAFCILEAILMQGPSPKLFYYNSTRLLIFSISLFSILLSQFYGAFIVSSLLSEAPRTITNLAALYNSSLEIGMENVPYNHEVFINTKSQLIHNLYQYRISDQKGIRHNIIDFEEGIKRIAKGHFAFHVAVDRAYRLLKTFLTQSEFCELQEIVCHPPFTFSTGLGIRKSTPLYEYVAATVAIFHESALLQYNNKKWEVNKIDCNDQQSDQANVDLKNFAPALAFLAFALLLSFVVLIIEILYKQIEFKLKLYKRVIQHNLQIK